MRRAYLTSSRALSALIMLLGLTMVISALAHGGGALHSAIVALLRQLPIARPCLAWTR